MMKGVTQSDYIIAIGMFIVIFGIVVVFVTNYLGDIRTSAEVTTLTGSTLSLLSLADFVQSPAGWPELQRRNDTLLLMHFTSNTSLEENASNVGAFYNITGKFGPSYTYYGTEFVSVGRHALNDKRFNFTVEAWIYLNNISGSQRVMAAKQENSTNGFGFGVLDDGLRFTFFGVANHDSSNLSIGIKEWTYVAAVVGENNVTLYVNNDSEERIFGTFGIANTDDDFVIGATTVAGTDTLTEGFNGSIDEVVVHNVTLSREEILTHARPETRLERMGLVSDIYEIEIEINNSKKYWYNQSANHTTLINEIVSVNISNILEEFEIDSVVVYNGNQLVTHEKTGSNISFVVSALNVNETLVYRVYVDDDPFADRSGSIVGSDNMSETVYAPIKRRVLSNQNIVNMILSNYTLVRDRLDIGNFRLTIRDMIELTDYVVFGEQVPRRGDVIALQRYFIYQNSTGGIRPGRLTIQKW